MLLKALGWRSCGVHVAQAFPCLYIEPLHRASTTVDFSAFLTVFSRISVHLSGGSQSHWPSCPPSIAEGEDSLAIKREITYSHGTEPTNGREAIILGRDQRVLPTSLRCSIR
ncbi:hypothetical protein K504DRAFT_506890 [Pleomassaria siparia CBS 279.74]|uniref:Uncharacterized protein n=1 Tax=Pleomassaria siparia CBS 279.74 TaxID=1314801 RepID=A0A6G1JVX4_9PLEO|nr:hypothetical protein K504DRAFT_506890 [Pleomassaria siparia CBS 279.74]